MNENRPNLRTATPKKKNFWNQYNSKNQNNILTHLTIMNENRPNLRTATPS